MAKKKAETYCADCMIVLDKDEVSLSKKLFGENILVYYCLNCTAGLLGCEVSDLEDKIQEFREQGCTLFL